MVKFIHGDCGQPVGTVDGTDGDLLAKMLEMMIGHFCDDMTRALETGMLGYRSSSMLSGSTQDALNVVADDPSPEHIAAACTSFSSHVRWLCSD